MTQQHSDSEGNKMIAIPISTGNAVTDVENNDGGDDGTVEEWAMLELNGELLLPTVVAAQNSGAIENESCKVLGRDGMELGSLQFRDKKTPILIVGSHELKGSIQTLPQPFGVLQKVQATNNHSSTDHAGSGVSYRLVGVVKHKILFQSYPKSILRY